MRNKKESPCNTCKVVKDPQACTEAKCVRWRKWFVEQWDEMRNGFNRLSDRLLWASDVRREILKVDPKLAYIVDRCKTADAKPVIRGNWIKVEDVDHEKGFAIYQCPFCGGHFLSKSLTVARCPRIECGAILYWENNK